MDFGYTIGDRVIQTEDKVIGEVIKMYYPTACKQQTMILCDDGRRYHAPSDTFIKVSELEEQIAKKIKDKPPQLAMSETMPLTNDLAQPLLVPHDYRNIKVADGTTVTIDLEELKKQLDRSQTTINQIDEIMEELFGVAHDVEKPGVFKEILKGKVNEKISNFLPTEPIKVAEMLITAKGECEPLHIGNDVFKDTYRIFDASELRQITEHLLVYCNHNVEAEE